ncbi:hypothetical protein [Streptomyces sp. NPDC051569]|uniref:hypothetical protein n=1 Tax=Streptomyces sp. NPDC051569 TaxID=3365661 RepID=UPI0037AF218D
MREGDRNKAIDESMVAFKEGLRRHKQPIQVVREFITHGTCAVINQAQHAELRERVAAELDVHPNRDVYTVGSAKLGFSIKPSRRYGRFNDESDIDVAVVSPDLYSRIWRETRAFIESKEPWATKKSDEFKKQHLAGRVSPKNIPKASPLIPTATRLWDIGRRLQNERVAGPYQITFAIWFDMEVLENYQANTVADCQKIEGL